MGLEGVKIELCLSYVGSGQALGISSRIVINHSKTVSLLEFFHDATTPLSMRVHS